jgi:hypothetical protein
MMNPLVMLAANRLLGSMQNKPQVNLQQTPVQQQSAASLLGNVVQPAQNEPVAVPTQIDFNEEQKRKQLFGI